MQVGRYSMGGKKNYQPPMPIKGHDCSGEGFPIKGLDAEPSNPFERKSNMFDFGSKGFVEPLRTCSFSFEGVRRTSSNPFPCATNRVLYSPPRLHPHCMFRLALHVYTCTTRLPEHNAHDFNIKRKLWRCLWRLPENIVVYTKI